MKEFEASIPCEHCAAKGYVSRMNPKWLRARRLKAGLSLRELARLLNVTASYLCDIELGRRPLRLEHRIASKYRKLAQMEGA